MAVNSITMTMAYNGTEFTRKYKLDDLEDSALEQAKEKILAINASLAGGNDGGLSEFFVADDFDGTNGKLKAISAAVIDSVVETDIPLQ